MWISGALTKQILAELGALTSAVSRLIKEVRMSTQAETDLTNAVQGLAEALAAETAATQAEVAALKAKIGAGSATPEDTAGIETNVTNLNNLATQLKAQAAASAADTAALNPPAAAPATPTT